LNGLKDEDGKSNWPEKLPIRNHPVDSDYRILPVEKPTDEMWEVIGHGIGQYNQQHGGPDGFQHLCLALYAPDGKVVGGLIGEIYWGWLYINLLFIREELRGHGYGHQLLTRAEDAARKRGATNAFFDTFSFQAPEFYKQHGYHIFGELKDFPPGHTRYYMTKQL
jgi:GNAT superfamily N-acetyltransferase